MIFIFFPSWTCCRVTVLWGSGTTTPPLSKSPPWATRARWARAGTSTDAPLVGPNHPRRWAELKGHRWAVKWVACTIRINYFFLCTFYIQSVLMWIGFRKEDVMGRDFFFQKQRTGTLKDISLAEAGRYGTLNEFAFFDKVSARSSSHSCVDNDFVTSGGRILKI